jgi:exopolyphosphatase/guanosine-5'-triphosphate,3'-diphosphate pyrophosphatase
MVNLLAPLSRHVAKPATEPRTAIIDIGSNSIRLVVYQGPARLPAILFNEKVLAGLAAVWRRMVRFRLMRWRSRRPRSPASPAGARMDATRVRTVATAAVRDAVNGVELIAHAKAAGLTVELLSGEQEALRRIWCAVRLSRG